ncbi:hypothetical protein Tco_0894712 [Tanacetum coccineum]|uniref:Uncharacterized protein n=1 Tax=Tanacetum coccineum TaxID=301880 RepID=A0ABQ5CCH1_9ASTR
MFKQDDDNITFKMPHTMEIFKQTRLKGLSTDSIPPSAYEENFGHGMTHYYQSLLIGDEYMQDGGDRRGIRHLIRLEKEMMGDKGEVALSIDKAANMIRCVSDDEIQSVMFSIGNDKAPGPDDYTSVFFKESWEVVGTDVCKAVRDFLSNDDIISDNQSAFVMGRSISNNILLTQELMDNYHLNRGPPRILIEALDEFERVSGLVPSIPKSTIFICNVLDQVKNDILQLMSFERGTDNVKISRKRSKPDKHGHGNGRAHKEPGEYMSCGALYTRNCGCSKGSLEDKILVPKPPQNCATCGNPVDGLNCRSCAFMRKCLNEGWYTIHDGNTSESFNHNTNVSCGNGAHIGYNCPPKALIISIQNNAIKTIAELYRLCKFHPTLRSGDENFIT